MAERQTEEAPPISEESPPSPPENLANDAGGAVGSA
jgi:hypothetical protein